MTALVLAAVLCAAAALGLFTAEGIYHRQSPRVRAGMVLLLIGLALVAVAVVAG